MKRKPVVTSNIIRFLEAIKALRSRPADEEGMGLLYGDTGEGKTTSVVYLCNLGDAIYLRARATWSVGSMLRVLVEELGLTPTFAHDPMVKLAIGKLRITRQPLFIDQADYLLDRPKAIDVLRDIYDETKIPVVLIGDEDLARCIKTNNRYDKHRRRISQWVHFSGITLEDGLKIISELAEIEIDSKLASRLHESSQGNIAAFTEGIRLIEQFGKANGLSTVSMRHWEDRPLPHPTVAGFVSTVTA